MTVSSFVQTRTQGTAQILGGVRFALEGVTSSQNGPFYTSPSSRGTCISSGQLGVVEGPPNSRLRLRAEARAASFGDEPSRAALRIVTRTNCLHYPALSQAVPRALREELSVPRDAHCCSRKRADPVCQASCCYHASEGKVLPQHHHPPASALARQIQALSGVNHRPPALSPGAQNIHGLLQPSSFSPSQRPFGRHPSRATKGGVSRLGQPTTSRGKLVPPPLFFPFRSLSYLYVWQNIALK